MRGKQFIDFIEFLKTLCEVSLPKDVTWEYAHGMLCGVCFRVFTEFGDPYILLNDELACGSDWHVLHTKQDILNWHEKHCGL